MAGSPFPKGTILADKYRVDRVIGEGGMGIVLAARHLTLDELVAIKILHVEASLDATAIARFLREAKATTRVKSEHAVRVLDVASLPTGQPYLVMEHLEGSDLDKLLETSKQLPIDDVLDYVLQACEALAEAHALGIVHRDLKPANLFATKRADGSTLVKVLDFGISKVSAQPGSFHASLTGSSEMMGSPLYMSPEQMRAVRDIDARSDIWAIGVILYELLVGTSPFMASSLPQICASIISDPPPPLRNARPDVPIALEKVILQCLAKERGDRFQNVGELAAALRPFAPARSQLSIDRVSRIHPAGAQRGATKILGPPSQTPASFPATLPLIAPATTGTVHTLSTPRPSSDARALRIAFLAAAGVTLLVFVVIFFARRHRHAVNAADPATASAPASVTVSVTVSASPSPPSSEPPPTPPAVEPPPPSPAPPPAVVASVAPRPKPLPSARAAPTASAHTRPFGGRD